MYPSAATTHDDTTRLHTFNDEASVVAAARNGDSGAFNVLAATYRKKIVNIARNITGNLDDAEDVAQQALMKAFCEHTRLSRNILIFIVAYTHCYQRILNFETAPLPACGSELPKLIGGAWYCARRQ